MARFPPPQTEQELMLRMTELAGRTLFQLANEIDCTVPKNLMHNKGWVGQLLEVYLGASAGNLSEPDFQNLGIELKTMPLTQAHTPKETTFVCVVPLFNHTNLLWQDSCVFHKLSRVLWLPIEADPNIALAKRKVGQGFIWSPSEKEMDNLKEDWEEFMELICMGQVETITAHRGEHLQIRPKAANASALTVGIGNKGQKKQTLPRGFYLRTSFTHHILKTQYKD